MATGPTDNVRRSAANTVAGLFLAQARQRPQAAGAQAGSRCLTYGELDSRSAQLASLMTNRGIGVGDRIAILTENRLEYLEVFLSAARIGAIVACQNWRLTETELRHCLNLVEPSVCFVSPRYADKLATVFPPGKTILFGNQYEADLLASERRDTIVELDPEAPFLILYTSGTTGLPKGAVISHRAEIARNMALRAEFRIRPFDTFVAWSPLYHMGAAEDALGTLMSGGKVIVVDGFDVCSLGEIIAREELGWLILMPGMVAQFAAHLEEKAIAPKGIRVCGVMADLVPPADIGRVTRLLQAPYANTFGATETGCPPCSSDLIPIGTAPAGLSKRQSPFCEVRLVDAQGKDVPDGVPGELCMRGPTIFSGYWRAPDVNEVDFRDGWFHMGDVFIRNPDGSLDFVDRVKYMIKSGGENIYPAEIERVVLEDPRVADAAVVRRADDRWGEVPVLFVARRTADLVEDDLLKRCRAALAGYKQPKAIHFIAFDEFPRSASGKIQRHELEKRSTL